MSTYVTSDAHGHLAALRQAVEASGFGEGDELYVLGDMIDRGPDPLGVISYVRGLPNTHVLLGNHEQLMLDAIEAVGHPHDGFFDLSGISSYDFGIWTDWTNNGGGTTLTQLEQLGSEDYADVLSWVGGLATFACVRVGERTYALTHAGIDPRMAGVWMSENPGADPCDPEVLGELLEAQDPGDLLWVREAFWGFHTGLVGADGAGPVVIAGHTPSVYLPSFAGLEPGEATDEDGRGKVVELGADEETCGVADRVDIDCAAACGFGAGRVGVMRLEDHACWYATVEQGE